MMKLFNYVKHLLSLQLHHLWKTPQNYLLNLRSLKVFLQVMRKMVRHKRKSGKGRRNLRNNNKKSLKSRLKDHRKMRKHS
jgi:hypothetical protein